MAEVLSCYSPLFFFLCQVEAEKKLQILAERVKIAEEQSHMLIKNKLEMEEEMERMQKLALKVWRCMHRAKGGHLKIPFDFQTPCMKLSVVSGLVKSKSCL